jgi:heat shock protein HtpX
MADWFRHWAFFGGSRDSDDDNNSSFGMILMIVGILLSILAPIAAMLMQMAISRKREYLADASAALLTRYPEGLARALEKISADSEPLEAANHATAHLFIANPFKGNKVSKLFSTHPPIEDRIAKLRGMEAQAVK